MTTTFFSYSSATAAPEADWSMEGVSIRISSHNSIRSYNCLSASKWYRRIVPVAFCILSCGSVSQNVPKSLIKKHSPSNPTLMGKKHLTPLYPTQPTYTIHQIPP